MAPSALGNMSAGFNDPVHDAQSAFREMLAALAYPGTPRRVDAAAAFPAGLMPAAGAVLLSLLDPGTALWLSRSAAEGDTAAWLRFHTGARIAREPCQADFALVGHPSELPALQEFNAGTDAHPELSATVVLQVESMAAGAGWRLSGPGIERTARLSVGGMAERFIAQWRESGDRFPCGVDFILACGNEIAGLPRTTRIEPASD